MFDHLDELVRRWPSGAAVGLATVVRTWSSAPRQAGSSLLVTASGEAVGNVSSGCVEAEVYELARTAAAEGAAPELRSYGFAAEDALAAGLSCGGTIEVFIEAVSRADFAEFEDVAAA
ncbi:MAG TPA: XdhC family protein, partial [Actinospica sp.]|nr:XdhC family protein [Actinospica sp.]